MRLYIAVHRHPTTGALLPLATIEYHEQSGAFAALRAAGAFDGPLRALGPKLVVALDPRGQIAHKLIRDVAGVVGPVGAQAHPMHSVQTPQTAAAQPGSHGGAPAIGGNFDETSMQAELCNATRQFDGNGDFHRGRDIRPIGGAGADGTHGGEATQTRDPRLPRGGWHEQRPTGANGGSCSTAGADVDVDATRRTEARAAVSPACIRAPGEPKRTAEQPALAPSSTRRGDWSGSDLHEWRGSATGVASAARPNPGSEGENSCRDHTTPAARPAPPHQPARGPLKPVVVLARKVPAALGKESDPDFDMRKSRPWSGRHHVECRKQRKLWLGDRGVQQKVTPPLLLHPAAAACVRPAVVRTLMLAACGRVRPLRRVACQPHRGLLTTLSAPEQFDGWREALGLPPIEMTVGNEAAAGPNRGGCVAEDTGS